MAISDCIALLKDVIISGAAVTGAVVAVKGLSAWKMQLKGQSDYDLSRRILVSLYKYRDGINGVRHPFMSTGEMPAPPESESEKMTEEEVSFYGTSNAYQARWDKLDAARSNLYADLLESEALWGNDLKIKVEDIFKLEQELLVVLRYHLILLNPRTKEMRKAAYERLTEKRRDILYDSLADEGDDDDSEFKQEVKEVIENIEAYLKPKLAR